MSATMMNGYRPLTAQETSLSILVAMAEQQERVRKRAEEELAVEWTRPVFPPMPGGLADFQSIFKMQGKVDPSTIKVPYKGGKSLMDMPPEVFNTILDFALLNDHYYDPGYHPDRDVIVVRTDSSSDYAEIAPFKARVISPSGLSLGLIATCKAINQIVSKKIHLKTFYFATLDVFWAFHHFHPTTARSIKNIDVHGYGHMAWSAMALLLRYPLDTLTLRCKDNPRHQFFPDAAKVDMAKHAAERLMPIFSGLSNQVKLNWAPTFVPSPLEMFASEEPRVHHCCTKGSFIADAITATIEDKTRASAPAPKLRRTKKFREAIEGGGVKVEAFMDTDATWISEDIADLFMQWGVLKLRKMAYKERMKSVRLLSAIWGVMDQNVGVITEK